MTGIIFVTRCLINGKLYVGLSTKGRKDYLGSGTYLRRAIKKYSQANFVRTDLDTFLTLEEGCAKERRWVAALNSKAPNGYNLTDGGEGVFNPSDEVRAAMSAHCSLKRPEVRAKLSVANMGQVPWSKGKKCPQLSAAGLGNKRALGYRHTDATKAKISANNAAKRPEVRAKISAALKGNVYGKGGHDEQH